MAADNIDQLEVIGQKVRGAGIFSTPDVKRVDELILVYAITLKRPAGTLQFKKARMFDAVQEVRPETAPRLARQRQHPAVLYRPLNHRDTSSHELRSSTVNEVGSPELNLAFQVPQQLDVTSLRA